MKLAFVHGWSVHHTDTYGELPRLLVARAAARGLVIDPVDVHLGRYISFRDGVRMDDVVRAFDRALHDAIGERPDGLNAFSCITHSTGGPVVREWVQRYHAAQPTACPLQHLIMLAPANHGSALAILGSSRLGRLKAWFEGIEPGEQILEWLELGSTGARRLNQAWLELAPFAGGSSLMPFVLTGEKIDPKLYDHVNSYTGEVGSDGVVRVAAANLAYSWLTLRQGRKTVTMANGEEALLLELDGKLRRSTPGAFRVLPEASHSGPKFGILRSPTAANADTKPVVGAILDALAVSTKSAYAALIAAWDKATAQQQAGTGKRRRFFQIVFQISDDQGARVTDYDVLLLAGAGFDPDKLRKGFFVDKQLNRHSPERITFYLDFDVMMNVPDDQFGFRIAARPDAGFAYYKPAEFRASAKALDDFVDPNTTLYVDIVLHRIVDQNVARFGPIDGSPGEFKDTKPNGTPVE
ncbi:MAG: hypothetical protein QM691_15020 [Opitutaceae bacterium]